MDRARSAQSTLPPQTGKITQDNNALKANTISAEVNNIAVPTLIVAGDQDRQDPVEQHQHEVLPRILGAKLQIVQDCGHLIPVDQPERLADAIRAFVLTAS